MKVSGWMTTRHHRRRREEVNSGSLFLQIWQLREATLNQRLRSFPTELRAAIFLQRRQDWPFPPLINRGSVDDLREEKIGSTIGEKPATSPVFLLFLLSLSLSLSLSILSLSQPCLQPAPPLSPPVGQPSSPPQFSLSTDASPFFSIAAAAHQHHHFLFLPSPAPAAATSAPTSTSTTDFTTTISINPAPHQWQSSHHDLLSLLLPTFLSPLQLFLLLPTADSGHHHLSWWHLIHRPNHLITTETPTPSNFLLPALPFPRRGCCMQNSFLHAASQLISPWFGPGQLWPHPYFFLKKKIQKISKILWKKLWFSQIFFYQFLYNIGLYIYTVKYKSGIKIPDFLRNVSKKKIKTFSKIKKYFIAYGQILKFFQAYFSLKKKTKIASFSC